MTASNLAMIAERPHDAIILTARDDCFMERTGLYTIDTACMVRDRSLCRGY
jgi:hypothetical protein